MKEAARQASKALCLEAEQIEVPARAQDIGEVAPLKARQRHSSQRRALRIARYEEVLRRHQAGQSIRSIGRAMDLDRRTVRGFVRAGVFPERAPHSAGTSLLDAHRPYMDARAAEGCRNAMQIWRELRARGFTGGHSIVRAAFAQICGHGPDGGGLRERTVAAPSTRRACAWVLDWHKKKHVAAEQAGTGPSERQRFVEALCRIAPAIETARHLAHEFFALMRRRDLNGFDRWLTQARVCEVIELHRFAAGLQADLSAVRAAFSSPWSSGQVEGQINRLKYLKRQMYGRAKLDLMRIRVLHPN
jgi:transposase